MHLCSNCDFAYVVLLDFPTLFQKVVSSSERIIEEVATVLVFVAFCMTRLNHEFIISDRIFHFMIGIGLSCLNMISVL